MAPPRTLRSIVALVLLAGVAGLAAAQGGLAYTVQVAALSDPESAIRQSGTLLRDGFPAYVVRAEGQAGTVFRVRVGAFGDRASADRYARMMGERAGGTPRPALAEAIPAGILPLAPTVVAEVAPDRRAMLLPWGEDGMILRVGPEGAPARYEPLDGGAAFEAIWAAPSAAGAEARDEVARVPLDGEATEEDPAEVREALFRQRLRLMAERSGQAEEALAEAVRGEPGSRHLVAWRSTDDSGAIHAVLARGADPSSRAADAWLGDVPPEPPAPLAVLSEGDGEVASEDAGEAADAVSTAAPDASAADDAVDPDAETAAAEPDAPVADDAADPDAVDPDADTAAPDASTDAATAAPDARSDAAADGGGEADGGPDAGDTDATRDEADEDGADAAPTEDEGPDEGGEDAPEASPSAPAEDAVEGDGWTALADDGWTVLQVGDVTWRALVGTPRAGVDDVLVLDVGDALEVVRLVPR